MAFHFLVAISPLVTASYNHCSLPSHQYPNRTPPGRVEGSHVPSLHLDISVAFLPCFFRRRVVCWEWVLGNESRAENPKSRPRRSIVASPNPKPEMPAGHHRTTQHLCRPCFDPCFRTGFGYRVFFPTTISPSFFRFLLQLGCSRERPSNSILMPKRHDGVTSENDVDLSKLGHLTRRH